MYTFLRISLFFLLQLLCVLAANTPDYEAACKAAGTSTLQPGRQYAFKDGGKTGHRRLIVGQVVQTSSGLDFEATGFELTKSDAAGLKMFHGARCHADQVAKYSCSRADRLKFKGEVKSGLTLAAIQTESENLVVANECYNVLTNSCQTHAKKLFKSIKARDLAVDLMEDSDMSHVLVRRDSGFEITPSLHMFARDLDIVNPFDFTKA